MATRRYGIAQDQTHYEVTEAAGIPVVNDPVEVTVDLDVIASKEEALRLIDQIRMFIVQSNWPPA